jgi:uncharacterized membrane protein (Fun14 family)
MHLRLRQLCFAASKLMRLFPPVIKIVDGAVGMVKMAIEKLSEQGVIDLDDDKKASMVSNLMVVLCSETPAQPVVNSGTLHN